MHAHAPRPPRRGGAGPRPERALVRRPRHARVLDPRARAGRLGLNATDVQDALRIWVDGKRLGHVLEGSVRIPLVVRGEESSRGSPDDLSHILVVLPSGETPPNYHSYWDGLILKGPSHDNLVTSEPGDIAASITQAIRRRS